MANRRQWLGATCVALGTLAWIPWLVWRAEGASAHPVWVVLATLEVLGVVSGLVTTAALLSTSPVRADVTARPGADPKAPDGYALVVSELLGRDSPDDMRAAVRRGPRLALARRSTLTDRALGCVLAEGVRRVMVVLAVSAGLLMGVAPFAVPPPVVLITAAVGLAATSAAAAFASGGRVVPGDRLIWSFVAIGLAVGARDRADRSGLLPARWAGVMAAIVVLNLAVALRGMSDRWTHGLPSMSDDARLTALLVALVLVASAVGALRRLPPPVASSATESPRRLEERTARQTALGATAAMGLIGLVAGLAPISANAADEPPLTPTAPVELVRHAADDIEPPAEPADEP